MRGIIFVISGPSGSGKTTLAEHVLGDRKLKKKLFRSISFTTRPRRSREKDKKDYYFITPEEFKKYLKAKKILEWTKYLGYYYATPKDVVDKRLKAGKSVILCLDFKGAAKIKRLYPKNTITIFVAPPSLEVLTHRIKNRCHRTGLHEIRRRVEIAKKELLNARHYDYCLLNQDLEAAQKELKEIIIHNLTKEG